MTERWTYGSRAYKCWNYISDGTTWELYDPKGTLLLTLAPKNDSEIIWARPLQ